MNSIATLGPAGTFSELAAKKYIEKTNKNIETAFYPTITKAFNSIFICSKCFRYFRY